MKPRAFVVSGGTIAIIIGVVVALLIANQDRSLVRDVGLSRMTIRPNGQSLEGDTQLRFQLSRRADVWVNLIAPDGVSYPLRERVTRAPDQYEIDFNGTVPVDELNRRVLPDGDYKLILSAEAPDGDRYNQELGVTIADADTVPVAIEDLAVSSEHFTPNYDGLDDEVRISYKLTKEAEVTVSVTNDLGERYILDPPTDRTPQLLSHPWDGTTGGRIMGGKLLPNGTYTVHVEARDLAGNISHATVPVVLDDGGTPRLEITDIRIWPVAVPLSGTINVRITVKNTGDTQIKTQGPPPGTEYTTSETFATFRDPNNPNEPLYFERPGVWRVGITWDNAPQEFPLRWGLFEDSSRTLGPGEEAIIEGKVKILQTGTRTIRFWAGVIQEGVGYPGGRVGQTIVTLSY